jgi:hypothetical protein
MDKYPQNPRILVGKPMWTAFSYIHKYTYKYIHVYTNFPLIPFNLQGNHLSSFQRHSSTLDSSSSCPLQDYTVMVFPYSSFIPTHLANSDSSLKTLFPTGSFPWFPHSARPLFPKLQQFLAFVSLVEFFYLKVCVQAAWWHLFVITALGR